MEEEARKRKERLAEFRKRKLGSSSNESDRVLSFRSYTPKDEKLQENVNIATPDDLGETVETETKHIPKETLDKAAVKEKEEVDLFNLAPKKPNWDLKRDVEKKLEKLDRRTKRAILEIIRDRLMTENGDKTSNLAQVVANAEAQQKLDAEED
ncbi:Coiled-coil domain-containing protein 12 [Apophysomyces sp. BC1034]|nr:Coiled-coil domain-containing protein 12 [Apophysomyces sp. BC1015]KAG0175967.1 Coiled-coil domain-containing protein 12 [Apophysomyces sp. BC1021]KAG0186972.1 Coiled-coil domain-containing protein 12 [Apophysomyces sp. BC1034]